MRPGEVHPASPAPYAPQDQPPPEQHPGRLQSTAGGLCASAGCGALRGQARGASLQEGQPTSPPGLSPRRSGLHNIPTPVGHLLCAEPRRGC